MSEQTGQRKVWSEAESNRFFYMVLLKAVEIFQEANSFRKTQKELNIS